MEWRQAADLQVSLSGGPAAVEGQPVSWTIDVANAGPFAANGALVTDAFPSVASGMTWTCAPAGGASCPASGSGDLAMIANLPAGGSLAIGAQGTVSGLGGARQVTNTVTVAVPAGMDDPHPADNAAIPDPPRGADDELLHGPPVPGRGHPPSRRQPRRPGPRGRDPADVSRLRGLRRAAHGLGGVAQRHGRRCRRPTGNVRLYPGGTPPPQASSLNYAKGATRANNATGALGSAGDLTALATQASGSVHLVLDVNGYYE